MQLAPEHRNHAAPGFYYLTTGDYVETDIRYQWRVFTHERAQGYMRAITQARGTTFAPLLTRDFMEWVENEQEDFKLDAIGLALGVARVGGDDAYRARLVDEVVARYA